MITHTERITGLTSISRVISFNAHTVCKQSEKDIKRTFGDEAKSVTYDNGIEFISWPLLQTSIGDSFMIYFADPYTPSQRGRNENTNGLIRDYLPKGTDFKKLKEHDILKIENSLNNRPRKRLGYLTPLEMYELVR